VPILTGTRVKVVEVVLDHLAHGSDAREIRRQYPHLSLGQIHSALAYYYDNQAAVDEDIARRLRNVEEIKARLGDSPLTLKLRAMKQLS